MHKWNELTKIARATYVGSHLHQGQVVLLGEGRERGEGARQGRHLGLGDGGAVAVVHVEHAHVRWGHLLHLGAVPLVIHKLGSARVAWKIYRRCF